LAGASPVEQFSAHILRGDLALLALEYIVTAMLLSSMVLLTTALAGPPAAPLSAEEKGIVAYAEAHVEEAIRLLERIVNVNSGTMNPSGVREVGDVLRPELAALGFDTRWIEMPAEMNRAGHLFAERRGTRG
jgi:glutamate carboxypeptidase